MHKDEIAYNMLEATHDHIERKFEVYLSVNYAWIYFCTYGYVHVSGEQKSKYIQVGNNPIQIGDNYTKIEFRAFVRPDRQYSKVRRQF